MEEFGNHGNKTPQRTMASKIELNLCLSDSVNKVAQTESGFMAGQLDCPYQTCNSVYRFQQNIKKKLSIKLQQNVEAVDM